MMRTVPNVKWAVGGSLPNAIIIGRDGFYVRWQESYGSLELCAGHVTAAGGLFQEWADGGWDPADITRRPELIRAHARRMIRAARNTYPELTYPELGDGMTPGTDTIGTSARHRVVTWHRTYRRDLITLGELAEELAKLDRRHGPQPFRRAP